MIGFEVDAAALHAANNKLTTVVDELALDHAVAAGQVEGLINGGWSGSAACSFAGGWAEWERGYHEAESALREMAALLGVTGATYEQAEDATHSTVWAAGGELL